MNEELKALEALNKVKKFKDDCCMFGSSDIEIDRELGIIETALKKYEKPKKVVGSISFEQSMENYVKNNCPSIAKKLKALEIIKEKEVDVHTFKFVCYKLDWDYEDYSRMSLEYKKMIALKHLSKGEFDLLKEVLL